MHRRCRIALAASRVLQATVLIALSAFGASAQSAAPPSHSTGTPEPEPSVKLFPSSDIYGAYVADPERPTNAISFGFYSDTKIPDTRSPRAGLSAGGRFGILRLGSTRSGGRAWQVNIDAGLDALFDMQNKEDVIGHDGIYGLSVTTASGGPYAFKVGIAHTSGHIGDEYEARTSAPRANYTRQEVALGLSRRLGRPWRIYGETGIAYYSGSDDQKPFRAQAGVEYESRPRLMRNTFSWYGAANFSLWQERGNRLDESAQAGIVTRSDGRIYRLGVGFTDGRPPATEFYRFSEAYMVVGFWIDF